MSLIDKNKKPKRSFVSGRGDDGRIGGDDELRELARRKKARLEVHECPSVNGVGDLLGGHNAATMKKKKKAEKKKAEKIACGVKELSSPGDMQHKPAQCTPTTPPSSSHKQAKPGRHLVADGSAPQHAFVADFNDHFETPFVAYADIAPILKRLAAKMQGPLRVYDPFFCKGSVVSHLKQLGFPHVYNRNEDFWAVLAAKRLPAFDVIVTNPPYSDEDKAKTLEFCASSGKPALVLLPSYCANKGWFRSSLRTCIDRVFFVKPATDYQYQHLFGKGHTASPFHSSWFCINLVRQEHCAHKLVCGLDDLVQAGVRFEKRLNPRQRKALRKKLAGAGAAGSHSLASNSV
jgi:hypothetical protein